MLSNMSASYDAAALTHIAYFLNTVGASGAVFGILFAFGWLYPDVPMYILFIPVPIRARTFVIIYALIELFAGLGSVAGFTADNVAHFAHLGGLLFGWLLILYWKKTNWREPGELFKRDKDEDGKFDNYHYHKRV
jgi:membrane associated rhomboid family serine protease